MRRFVGYMYALAALAALVLAGCGSSSSGGGGAASSSGTGTGGSSSSPFTVQANGACKTRSDAVTAASEASGTTAASAVKFTTQLEGTYQQEIKSLKAVTPPPSVKSAYAAFVSDQQSILNDASAGKQAAEKNDASAYGAAQKRALATQLDSFPKAQAAGLTICAEKLPASDEAAVKKLAVDGAVHPTASLCTRAVTEHFLSTAYQGSVTKCEQSIVKSHASSAQVTRVYGIVPSATVYLSQRGSSPPKLLLNFLKQNGAWKVDSVSTQP